MSFPNKKNKHPFHENLLYGWPLLLGPAAMACCYAAYFAGRPGFYQKRIHEILALIILFITGTIFFLCAVRYRRPIVIILTVLTVAFFCREWHFAGTSKGVYVTLAIVGFWAYVWRDKIAQALKNRSLKIWLIATFVTYFLSQLIARRAFRSLHLPLELQLHVPMEEVVETTAHIMLLVTSLIAWKYSMEK